MDVVKIVGTMKGGRLEDSKLQAMAASSVGPGIRQVVEAGTSRQAVDIGLLLSFTRWQVPLGLGKVLLPLKFSIFTGYEGFKTNGSSNSHICLPNRAEKEREYVPDRAGRPIQVEILFITPSCSIQHPPHVV